MTKRQTSVYLRTEQIETIETIVRESQSREDVPELSKSEVHRRLLDSGIEDDPELGDMIPEHRRILHQRERFIDGEVKLQRLRTGFEGRCKRTVKKRFKQGIRPDELDTLGDGLKRDARILWPEDDARRRDATDYVDQLIDSCREAIEASDHDPLDPETIFESIGDVRADKQREAIEADGSLGDLVAEAKDRIETTKKPQRGGQDSISAPSAGPDPDALAKSLANAHGVDLSVAEDAVEQAIEHTDAKAIPSDD